MIDRRSRRTPPRRSTATADALVGSDELVVPALHGDVVTSRLANGLTVCVVENHRAPLVSTALWYRVGTRDEDPRQVGIAHFLEHMMFKGSAGYGPGEIDRLTQSLGGANNAFTSHDATAYHFDFAADRFATALAIEADRMAGLRLEPSAVASERQVILEEIGMYEDDPWDALELAVHAAFFGEHPYARSVLGHAETLAGVGPDELAAFHHRFYGPDNAVLVVSGDVGPEVVEAVEATLGQLPPRGGNPPRPRVAAPITVPAVPPQRLERRYGEVARGLITLPGPSAPSDDHAGLRFLLSALVVGRASRLQRALVDEGQLCSFVSADVSESPDRGLVTFACELLPGVEPATVEAALWHQLELLTQAPLAPAEADRIRRVMLADWVFGHEGVHQQAISVGAGVTLFSLGHAERQLRAALACDLERLPGLAARYLHPERGALIGWSLPAA